jgi:uncharacterized membrane protein
MLARGQHHRMEGGVGIILLLAIVVVAGFVIAMYLTGGALLSGSRKDETPPSEKADPTDRSDVYAQHDELR